MSTNNVYFDFCLFFLYNTWISIDVFLIRLHYAQADLRLCWSHILGHELIDMSVPSELNRSPYAF